jgi:pimeloyl-ACP methyl ester carboxylesterase
MPEQLSVDVGDTRLHTERWPGDGPTVILLHAGICDLRSWRATAELLAPLTVVAYDRRGFGSSPGPDGEFRHVDDLHRVLDAVSPNDPAVLVGSSMGGGVALDLAVSAPDRVSALVLLAPAVSGAPDVEEVDADTQRLGDLLDKAMDGGDNDEVNRLEMWLWLDGPTAPEGRVGGAARALALEMNAALLSRGESEHGGASGIDAWQSLEEVRVPTTVSCGDLDLPFFLDRCREIARRVPNADYTPLPGMAHLPYLEDPQQVARLLTRAVARASDD